MTKQEFIQQLNTNSFDISHCYEFYQLTPHPRKKCTENEFYKYFQQFIGQSTMEHYIKYYKNKFNVVELNGMYF